MEKADGSAKSMEETMTDDGLVVTGVPGRLAKYLCMKFGTTIVPLARFQSEDTVKVFMDYLQNGAGKPLIVIDEDLQEEGAVFADPAESHENGTVKFCVLCRSGEHGKKPVELPPLETSADWSGPPRNYTNRGG
jgi:hypothetical protein